MLKLYRLDETCWSLQNGTTTIHIRTPGFDDRRLDYDLADKVASCLNKEAGVTLALQQGVDFSDSSEPQLKMKWAVQDITQTWFDTLQKTGIIPSYRVEFKSPPVQVLQITPSGVAAKASRLFSQTKKYFSSWIWTNKPTCSNPPATTFSADLATLTTNFLEKGAYQDPFTQLAAEALQQAETPFVAEGVPAGSSRYVLRSGVLSLEPNSLPLDKKAATDALILFSDFLRASFAWKILDGKDFLEIMQNLRNYSKIFSKPFLRKEQLFGYLKCTLGINLQEMAAKNLPLLPDHVFKCNMAVNNIEMLMVESLWVRVKQLKLMHIEKKTTLKDIHAFKAFLRDIATMFSYREIRGLFISFQKFTTGSLDTDSFKTYCESFEYLPKHEEEGFGEKIRDLKPDSFHRLMEILYVDTDAVDLTKPGNPERFFTGRKIVHLGITGYKTMGNKAVYDPSRNLFELFHVFPSLRQENVQLANELLAFVVSKKSLWSHYPIRPADLNAIADPAELSKKVLEEQRRVARLIPYPTCEGQKRWYYVDGLLNDGKGNVNYVLVPASKGYLSDSSGYTEFGKRAPLIKLYRSTASDFEAENSIDSLLADTNPNGVGSLNDNAGLQYQVAYFARCTMPLWTAYLIKGDTAQALVEFKNSPKTKLEKDKIEPISTNEKRALLTEFIAWQLREISKNDNPKVEEAQKLVADFITKVNEKTFDDFLLQTVEGQEWGLKKASQDIHFVGHSLGGALSQSGLCKFGAADKRIPLYGCNYKCFAYDSPGIKPEEALPFINFGNANRDLLGHFGQKWEIHYQFEYKDFVPLGGKCFLGAFGYNKEQDASWLTIKARVCKPLESASDVAVLTAATHGRRFVQAAEMKSATKPDYKETDIPIDELLEVKYSILKGRVRKDFGYWLTALGEPMRQSVGGTLIYNYLRLKKKLSQERNPAPYELDKEGVLFCVYDGRGVNRSYTTAPQLMLLFNRILNLKHQA